MKYARRSPLLLLLVALVSVLGGIGVAYGAWAQPLNLAGTVQTATFAAEWMSVSPCQDYEVAGHDYARVESTIDSTRNNVLFSIYSGYPGYRGDCSATFRNTGSIKAAVVGTTILAPAGSELDNCSLSWEGSGQKKTLTCDQLLVTYADGLGSTLWVGDEKMATVSVTIRDGASPGTMYQFVAKDCLGQVDQSMTADQCFAGAQ